MKLEVWRAEVDRRGRLACKFRCPVCGNEASMQDWLDLRPEGTKPFSPERATQECIGRVMQRDQIRRAFPLEAEPDAPEKPCDYAAFGLIGLPDLLVVEMPEGRPISVFPFATGETP